MKKKLTKEQIDEIDEFVELCKKNLLKEKNKVIVHKSTINFMNRHNILIGNTFYITENMIVDMFDLNDNYLETFQSAKEASKKTKLKYDSILQNVHGYLKKVGNYKFKLNIKQTTESNKRIYDIYKSKLKREKK